MDPQDVQTYKNCTFQNALTVGALCRALGMAAENIQRSAEGKTIAYGMDSFEALISDNGLYHNALCTSLNGR